MKHLSTDEILEFVAVNEISSDSLELSARVNRHIRDCEKCRKTVSAFQAVYDELCRMGERSEYTYVGNSELRQMLEAELCQVTEKTAETNLKI